MKELKVVLNYTGDFLFNSGLVEPLRRRFPEVSFFEWEGHEPTDELKDAVVFVGWPTNEMLQMMKQLKWLHLPSAGANGFTDHPDLDTKVIITNSSGVFGVSGAEHALALMLAFARQLSTHIEQQKQRIWKRNPYCLQIQESTVAVIGLGDIGSETASRAKALGARVLAVKRTKIATPPFVDELYHLEDIDQVLAQADFVVNALPLTDETERFFSRQRIAKIKQGAVFINVGRGATVDEEALIEYLQSGHLEGAGLDVTEIEPLPDESVLWDLPNVIITSHSVGVTPRKQERRVEQIEKNLVRFLQGESLMNVVNRKLGY
jgi:phosphoglycerate dehydrogenase-like enzyme